MTIKIVYGIDISHIQNELPEKNYYEYIDLICDLVEYDFHGYTSIYNDYESDNLILIVGSVVVKDFSKSNIIKPDDLHISSYDSKKCQTIFDSIPTILDNLNEEIKDYNKEQISFIKEWHFKNKDNIKANFHIINERYHD